MVEVFKVSLVTSYIVQFWYNCGMKTAFTAIYREHLARLTGYAIRVSRLTCYREIDSLVSVGSVALWKSTQAFDASRGLSLWAYASKRVYGAMLDEVRGMDWLSRYYRRAVREDSAPANTLVDLDHARELPGADNPEANVSADERASTLRTALDKLPPRQADILKHCYWEGKTLNEIGRTYALSEGRICQVKTVALDELRAILLAYEFEDLGA